MTETAPARPMSWADRMWLDMSTSIMVGPLRLPDIDALRDAFCRLGELGENTRLGYSISEDRAHWRFDPSALPQLAHEAVVELDAPLVQVDTPEPEVLALANRLLVQSQRIAGPEATLIIRAGSFLIYRQNHALGDAQPILNSVSALVHVAAGDDIPAWARQEVIRHPVRVALANTFGPGKQRLLPLVRQRFTKPIEPRVPADPVVAAPVREPDLAVYFTVIGRDSWQRIKQWRRSSAEDTSMASIYLILARRALRAVGVPISVDTTVLYDCRRHLPAGVQARGNLVVGFCQQLPDDPVEAGRVIAATATSGRVLLTLASAIVKRHTVTGPDDGPVNPVKSHSELAYVFAPRHRGIEMLPWLRPDLRGLGVLSTTSDLAGITITLVFVGGRLSASWSFHRNVVDEELIRAATQLMDADPVALLNQDSGEVFAEESELGRRD